MELKCGLCKFGRIYALELGQGSRVTKWVTPRRGQRNARTSRSKIFIWWANLDANIMAVHWLRAGRGHWMLDDIVAGLQNRGNVQ